ncbi:MAG: acylphosphatase [Candidatus Omnitrophota bacterium]
MSRKRLHIIYTGTVQGVGFRWTAEKSANSAGVTGWVRNVPDGTVEVMAEGEEEALVGLIRAIKNVMQHYIEDTAVEWLDYKDEFKGFRVRFY